MIHCSGLVGRNVQAFVHMNCPPVPCGTRVTIPSCVDLRDLSQRPACALLEYSYKIAVLLSLGFGSVSYSKELSEHLQLTSSSRLRACRTGAGPAMGCDCHPALGPSLLPAPPRVPAALDFPLPCHPVCGCACINRFCFSLTCLLSTGERFVHPQ